MIVAPNFRLLRYPKIVGPTSALVGKLSLIQTRAKQAQGYFYFNYYNGTADSNKLVFEATRLPSDYGPDTNMIKSIILKAGLLLFICSSECF